MYEFLTPKEHIITVRDRNTGYAKQYRYWNEKIISKVLARQTDSEDVFVSKYPKSRLINTIILDFDSENKEDCYNDVMSIKNALTEDGHNCVVVDSTNKGYHLYIQIAPFLFKDTDIRWNNDWDRYFKEFVNYLICHISSQKVAQKYLTQDAVNTNAGMGGNIRLIGSKHPSTNKRVSIIDGEFIDLQKPTKIQDKAQRIAWNYCAIREKREELLYSKTRIVDGNDPIESNDLRVILPAIFGEEIHVYKKGYGFMKCPFHNDNNPSLLVTKEYYSCASCGEKGNIFTLKKKGLVEFDNEGGALY